MERIITKSFARLMGRGTHRGFITYEELSKSLGKRNLSQENLAQAFIHILDDKVTLVEKKSDYKVLRKKESSSKNFENYDMLLVLTPHTEFSEIDFDSLQNIIFDTTGSNFIESTERI